MPVLRFPLNVTAVTINAVPLVPDANGDVTVASVATASDLVPQQNQPAFVIAAANGNVTIKLRPSITSITIGGVAYVPDGSNNIVVPAAAASAFLRSIRGQPISYASA